MKVICGFGAFKQTLTVPEIVAIGLGLTFIVNVLFGPVQLTPKWVKVGVTVMVAVIAVEVVLFAVKPRIGPFPLVANPIAELELVQE